MSESNNPQNIIRNANRSLTNEISENPFFGIWKDRKEMVDSVKWVKNVRKKEWSNS